ncbi:hypothetical protein ACIBM4_26095 [Streptomyces sp. NPDC050256]|uniref:hypothetical protein n=1 Tax=Streptomyces sp. NPDC050256 TaxID=3365607 RepID=UPI00378907CB
MRYIDVPSPPPCTGCGLTLPRTDEHYARDAMSPQGLRRRCRTCRAAEERARYAEHSATILQFKRERRITLSAHWAQTDHWNAA